MKSLKSTFDNSKGMTLLFASLVVSLLLSVGLAIADIALSQILLSAAAKDSAAAFYAADTGIECALYYENKIFTEDQPSFFPSTTGDAVSSIICNGNGEDEDGRSTDDVVSADVESTGGSRPTITTTYVVNNGSSCDSSKPSFILTIEKREKSGGDDNYDTTVRSYGYNDCDPNSPRRVERGLQVTY